MIYICIYLYMYISYTHTHTHTHTCKSMSIYNPRRCPDPQERQAHVELVEGVRDSGGAALICSTMHVSGQHLQQLGGLAAILRFDLCNACV